MEPWQLSLFRDHSFGTYRAVDRMMEAHSTKLAMAPDDGELCTYGQFLKNTYIYV